MITLNATSLSTIYYPNSSLVESGVRQTRGIQRTLANHFEGLDFAGDLVLLSARHLQEKTTMLNKYAGQTGPQINKTKTQVMHINSANERHPSP